MQDFDIGYKAGVTENKCQEHAKSGSTVDVNAKNFDKHIAVSAKHDTSDTLRSQSRPSLDSTTARPRHMGRKLKMGKSIGSHSTMSTVPVLVRSYVSPNPARPSRSDLGGSSSSINISARSQGASTDQALPPVSDFAFAHVLLAVESNIRDPIEAISTICARSRYSLADEYGAHLPPQGEIHGIASNDSRRHGLFIRTAALADSALSIVQEASSSSAASESGTMRSTYDSLQIVLSRPNTEQRSDISKDVRKNGGNRLSWVVDHNGHQGIVLAKTTSPLKQVHKVLCTPLYASTKSQRSEQKSHIGTFLDVSWLSPLWVKRDVSAYAKLKEILQAETLDSV